LTRPSVLDYVSNFSAAFASVEILSKLADRFAEGRLGSV